MRRSELVKLLKLHGCYSLDKGTNHEQWFSPISNRQFSVPRHGGQEVATGTLNKILKQAGIKK